MGNKTGSQLNIITYVKCSLHCTQRLYRAWNSIIAQAKYTCWYAIYETAQNNNVHFTTMPQLLWNKHHRKQTSLSPHYQTNNKFDALFLRIVERACVFSLYVKNLHSCAFLWWLFVCFNPSNKPTKNLLMRLLVLQREQFLFNRTNDRIVFLKFGTALLQNNILAIFPLPRVWIKRRCIS